MLTEAVFSKSLFIKSQGRRSIAIGAMLVTAWLSTATALANGPESQAVKAQTPESQPLRLHSDDGLLSLHASQRPYTEVLGAIRKETGIRFHYTIPMSGAVTLSFNDLPVQEALRLLGREAQLTFRFPEGPSAASRARVPEEVWIFGKVSDPIAEVSGPTDKSAAAIGEGGVARAQSQDPPAPADEPQPDADPGTGEQPDIESLIESTKSADPMLRLQAVSALAARSSQDNQEAVNVALHAALTDPDAPVRAQAVLALVTRGGPEATGYLEQGLRDQDPGVRIMALQSAVPAQHGVDLVKQALSDADPAVRAMAQAKLHPEAP